EPNRLTIPRPMRISTQIKKGRSAGQTTLNHSIKPSREAAKASSGYLTMNITRIQKIMEYVYVAISLLFIMNL
ncbi:MAG: hypothetical protein PHC45_09240, partial [Clostridiaceae bacterium]|nr:hypothetical protein [Clostridiaceae bacterium]